MIYGDTALEMAEGALLVHSVSAGNKRFKKGRRLSAEDIEALRAAQITSVVTVRLEQGDVHEDRAAAHLAEALGSRGAESYLGYRLSAPFTGRVNLISNHEGIVTLNTEALERINLIDEALTIATVPEFERVRPRQMIATVKIIPFAVPEQALKRCEEIALSSQDLIRVRSFQEKRIGFIQTQVPHLKTSILDKTTQVLSSRLEGIGAVLVTETRCPHTTQALTAAITTLQSEHDTDIVLVAGASAITDRRDIIPAAIEAAGGHVDHFGMPVDPGNLLLIGSLQGKPVIGMPGCARSAKLNGFDWVLERLAADIPITKTDIMRMGVGGLLKEIETRPQPRAGQKESVEKPAIELPHAPQVNALLLAAGRSSRMGEENKLTAVIGDKPMVRQVADNLINSGVAHITVVTGHETEAVQAALAGLDVSFVHNPLYADGMSTSLKAGLSAVADRRACDAVLVSLGDMPEVSEADINKLIAAFNPLEGRAICIPTYAGKRGNPILFDRTLIPIFEQAKGDIGARRLIAEREDITCEVETGPGVLRDVDTPHALAEIRKQF